MTETLVPQQAAVDDTSATWYRILRKVGLVYIYSRLCVLAGAAIVAAELQVDINQVKGLANVPFPDPNITAGHSRRRPSAPISDVLSSWDGIWYMRHRPQRISAARAGERDVLRHRRPRRVLSGVSRCWSERVDRVLPGGDTLAALFTNFVLGAVAIFLLGVLARQLYGEQVAAKAMVLGAMFPGSFVLSFAYTEALLLVLAMGCLWCLMSKRWVGCRAARRTCHRDAPQRPGAGAGLCGRCRSWPSAANGTGSHSPRRSSHPQASSPFSCGSVITPVRRVSGSVCRARPGARVPATA